MTVFDTDSETLVPAIPRRPLGLFGTLAGVILTLRPRSRGSPDLPDWLRKDIGLPPVERSRPYWEFR